MFFSCRRVTLWFQLISHTIRRSVDLISAMHWVPCIRGIHLGGVVWYEMALSINGFVHCIPSLPWCHQIRLWTPRFRTSVVSLSPSISLFLLALFTLCISVRPLLEHLAARVTVRLIFSRLGYNLSNLINHSTLTLPSTTTLCDLEPYTDIKSAVSVPRGQHAGQ